MSLVICLRDWAVAEQLLDEIAMIKSAFLVFWQFTVTVGCASRRSESSVEDTLFFSF